MLEQRASESNLTRAFAVHARTLELLDARGLADRLVATGQEVSGLQLFSDVALDLSHLPTRFPFLLITPQYEVERLLEERAKALGADIVRDAEVVGLRQGADGVEVDVRMHREEVRTRRASYLVGADGVNSTVRQALGLAFPGRSAVASVMLADVRLAQKPEHALMVNGVRDGFAFIAPFGDGWYRVIALSRDHLLPDEAPVDFGELRAITRKALGSDYGMHDPRWTSRFHSDERQAPRYRVGRVFLAGDAAHVHSPALGLGMNTGIQDAANLSWKLAATVQGWAPDGLLDTYEAERHPVGALVLRASGTMLRLALLRSPVLIAVRNQLGGALLRIRPLEHRMAGVVSGVDIDYPAPRGAHRLVGKRAPDLRLAAGEGRPERLYEALRDGRFVLLAAAHGRPYPISGWTGRVDCVTAADATRTMLVRPDGHIAWTTDEDDPARYDAALRTALAGWCGTPTA